MDSIITPSVIVCGVDNDRARVAAAKLALRLKIPAIFTAVSPDGEQGYCFVQEPGQACFGCLYPEAVGNHVTPCPNAPAIKDILKCICGVVLYAVDTVLMDRPRTWNYRVIRMAAFLDDLAQTVPRRVDCPLCSERHHG